MTRQRIAAVEVAGIGIVEIGLDILGILYSKHFVHPIMAFLPRESRNAVEKVARQLSGNAQIGDVRLDCKSVQGFGRSTPIGTRKRIAHPHDEMVLVAVAQKRIRRRYLIDEIER